MEDGTDAGRATQGDPTPGAASLPPLARAGLLGPVFAFDLTRQARKGRTFAVRFFFALSLFVVLAIFFLGSLGGNGLREALFSGTMNLPQRTLANLTDRFVAFLLTAQGFVLVLLTPPFVAGAVAEERQKRTLELLFATHLTDRELLLGKLASRLAQLGTVWLAGLPLLAILQLWGGVSLPQLAAGFAATGVTVLMVAAVSLAVSVRAETPAEGIRQAYVYTLMFSGFGGCLFVPVSIAATFASGGAFTASMAGALYPLLVIAIALFLAWRWLRPETRDLKEAARRFVPPPRPKRPAAPPVLAAVLLEEEAEPAAPARPVARDAEQPGRRRPQRDRDDETEMEKRRPPPPLPPLTIDPIVWKEMYLGIRTPRPSTNASCAFGCVALLGGLLFLGLVSFLLSFAERSELDGLVQLARGLLCLGALVACASVLLSAVRAIVVEREQDTLLSLLTLPYTTRRLLWAKWRGALLRPRGALYTLVGTAALAGTVFLVHPASLALFLVLVSTHVALAASLGLFVSQQSRGLTAANFTAGCLLALALVVLLVFLQAEAGLGARSAGDRAPFLAVAYLFDPLRAWWEALQPWSAWNEAIEKGDRGFLAGQLFVLPAVMLHGFFAWWLFTQTVANFRRESRR